MMQRALFEKDKTALNEIMLGFVDQIIKRTDAGSITNGQQSF